MFVKIDNNITEINVLGETELKLYFYELCQMAKGNPWRGIELSKAQRVLEELRGCQGFELLKTDLEDIRLYRENYVADPSKEKMPTNWVEAMGRHYRKNNDNHQD